MLQTKALYNLLRFNAAEDPSIEAELWAVEDLRKIDAEELFKRLRQQHQVLLDKKALLHFAEQCDTPEELADLLLPDDADETTRDPFYLTVFELWRRFLPEKQTLSIFCDELDRRIELYEEGELESEELIQDAVANLLEVLEDNADTGADPQQIFAVISDYCAHDLEGFIYNYISDLLNDQNSLYASELIEGFSSYALEPLWFDFLKVRLLGFTDIADANAAMHRLLENEMDLLLLLEMLQYLSAHGEYDLFKLCLKKALPLATDQKDLLELTRLTASFYSRFNEEENERQVQKLLTHSKREALRSALETMVETSTTHPTP